MEPQVAVATLERALRLLLTRVLRAAWPGDWLERVTTPELLARWRSRYTDERAKRPGVTTVAPVGLDYSELHELIDIADANWDKVAPALGKRHSMVPLLKHFERVRNTASHSRDLMPFERELMSGIAGEIRNKVTIFMSTQDPAGDYYPRMESAHDSFGATIAVREEMGEIAGLVPDGSARTVLRVGDVVTFTCTGTDPKGRDLEWTLALPNARPPAVRAPSGEPVELEWHVAGEHVSEACTVEIYMSVADSPYHRWGWFDHRTYFMYTVRPPDFDV